MKNLEHYYLLAELFKYPDKDIITTVAKIQDFLNKNYPDAGAEFKRFSEFIANSTYAQVEEIFQKHFIFKPSAF